MKINFQNASLYHSCYEKDALFRGCDRRHGQVPQLMILGKSNVGKSSLFNAITKTRLAKVSSTPGKTQALFFYMIDSKLLIVDMPGLGFAKVGSETKDTWAKLLEAYLSMEIPSRKLLYLHDARREWDPGELQMLSWFHDKKIPIGICITKCDKLNSSELKKIKSDSGLSLDALSAQLFFFSTEDQKLKSEFELKLTDWFEEG